MLVSDIIPGIRDILGDLDETRWTDATLIRSIDKAQKRVARGLRNLKNSKNIVVHSGQSNYTTPSDFQSLTFGSYNGVPLTLMSQDDMFELDINWETNTAEEPDFIVFNDSNREVIKIYPIPTFTEDDPFVLEDANLLTIHYIRKPVTITARQDLLRSMTRHHS